MGSINVGVGSVVPGTGATNLGKLEDSPHATGDVGVAILARRSDTPASSGGTDGDYSVLNTDSTGKLWVNTNFPLDTVTSIPTVGLSAIPSGGYTKKRLSLTTTVLAIRGSAQAKLGGWFIQNPNAVTAFIQLFDVATAGAVTLGVTVPDVVLSIPAFGAANVLDGTGINFANGAQAAATTTATGSSALTTAMETSWFYK